MDAGTAGPAGFFRALPAGSLLFLDTLEHIQDRQVIWADFFAFAALGTGIEVPGCW